MAMAMDTHHITEDNVIPHHACTHEYNRHVERASTYRTHCSITDSCHGIATEI